mgnify:CR=1 FL=1
MGRSLINDFYLIRSCLRKLWFKRKFRMMMARDDDSDDDDDDDEKLDKDKKGLYNL